MPDDSEKSGGGPTEPVAEGARVEDARAQVLKRAPDFRRTLPTQDWVARLPSDRVGELADVQILATSHFYTGLQNLRADFTKQVFFPPPTLELPRQLGGRLLLPDGSPAALIAVTVLPLQDAFGAEVTIQANAVTDEHGQFRARQPAQRLGDAGVVGDAPVPGSERQGVPTVCRCPAWRRWNSRRRDAAACAVAAAAQRRWVADVDRGLA